MNVSFIDMCHSLNNDYKRMHLILCGQDRERKMHIIAHALVLVESSEYYDQAFEIYYKDVDSSGQSLLQDWLNKPGNVQFSDRTKGIPIAEVAI